MSRVSSSWLYSFKAEETSCWLQQSRDRWLCRLAFGSGGNYPLVLSGLGDLVVVQGRTLCRRQGRRAFEGAVLHVLDGFVSAFYFIKKHKEHKL